eukprot:6173783-Pleurochrysis_carterae.AAC.1
MYHFNAPPEPAKPYGGADSTHRTEAANPPKKRPQSKISKSRPKRPMYQQFWIEDGSFSAGQAMPGCSHEYRCAQVHTKLSNSGFAFRTSANTSDDVNVNDADDDTGDWIPQRDEYAHHSESEFDEDEASATRAAPKLWGKELFPQGRKGELNWDMVNLLRAQEWECPCTDRKNCISPDRIPLFHLYDHRREWQQKASSHAGQRDYFRSMLEAHYSKETRQFSRSFVVGRRNDVCAAAIGLAYGLSVSTFYNARSDCRLNKPWHAGRCSEREKLESVERTHLEAYIRDLRSSMEGDKGGASFGHWHTGRRSCKLRWEDYCKMRARKSLPVVGSFSLFYKIWREHTEISEYSAKSHPKCDTCGKYKARKDAIEHRTDPEA